MDKNNLQQDPKKRALLRKVGWGLVSFGGLLAIIAFIDFVSAFSSGSMPVLFFLFFLAFPLLSVGILCLKFGYMGAVARYTSSEIAPVAKDTINYMVDGTKDSIVGMVKEFKGENTVACPSCNKKNNSNAKYCDNCGKALAKECTSCQTINTGTAKYCQGCGRILY